MDLEVQGREESAISTTKVEALLAKANLLRLRGQFEPAEEICLEVLTAEPKHVFALCLLGDIRLSQDRLQDAENLYDLALQTGEAPSTIQDKLTAIRSKAVEPLNWTKRSKPSWLAPFAIALGFMTVIVLATLLAPKVDSSLPVSVRVIAPKEPEKASPPMKPLTVHPHGALDDESLAQTVGQKSGLLDAILSATHDPRTSAVTLTVVTTDEPKKVAELVAYWTLNIEPALQAVSVRVIKDERVAYIADLTRAKYDEAVQQTGSKVQDSIDGAMSNEWLPGQKRLNSTVANGTTTPHDKDRP